MSERHDPFDPSEVEDRPRSQHVSKRDVVAVVVALLLIVPLGFFIFRLMQRNAEAAVCKRNLKEIFTAAGLYLLENDDRYPPTYARDAWDERKVSTWATLLYRGMNRRFSFRCPTAHDEEAVRSVNSEAPGGFVPTTYGLYAPREFFESASLNSPGHAVLFGETSDNGTRDTFDPHPLVGRDALQLPHDGFAIGWSDGNEAVQPRSTHVTRLAFPDTAAGRFPKEGRARHGDEIHALFADGHVRGLKPPEARIQRIGADPSGLWAVR